MVTPNCLQVCDRQNAAQKAVTGLKPAYGTSRMQHSGGALMAVLLLSALPEPAQADELFKLSNGKNISCSRDLSRGKLRTAMCTSYTHLLNVRTSEYFRCQMSLAVTRDKKEVLIVSFDGRCARKPPIFPNESNYDFNAEETEPTNMNAFFGSGGHSVWAADTTRQKVRGCITIESTPGSSIARCLDMGFE